MQLEEINTVSMSSQNTQISKYFIPNTITQLKIIPAGTALPEYLNTQLSQDTLEKYRASAESGFFFQMVSV